ncbi:MAG: class I SAM-dependent methyltransferase [Acidobacteria bacterium]|nr:class I SAM-dependent methyltransferase [Acidobacteriota bacterium]
MSHLEVLDLELGNFHLDLASDQKLVLSRYCDELVHWNKRINLTSLQGAAMVRRLVVEPAWIARELRLSGILADIGSGNGSPAIPLHVLSELRETHLVEARTKRAAFLRHVVGALKLTGVTVHRARFEEMASTLGRLDWITLQGVAPTDQLIDSIRYCSGQTTIVVWITSEAVRPKLKPQRTLQVPITGTQVFLFQLDLT